jgi:hypothetical protein
MAGIGGKVMPSARPAGILYSLRCIFSLPSPVAHLSGLNVKKNANPAGFAF